MSRIIRQKNKGFTLLEVLIALAILASLSVAAYQVLNQVQTSSIVTHEKEQRLAEIQRTLAIMDNDFRQMALRKFRTDGEKPGKLLLVAKDNLMSSDSQGIMFTRYGWLNPQMQFPRGEVTKVGYRVIDEQLQRIWWRYPDTPVGDSGNVMKLLTQVESMTFRYYYKKKWVDTWDNGAALPNAVGVKFKLKDYGEIERIYLTPGAELGASDD
ncbi:Type II secretion system protein J precursor [Vibrio aerogenes CECT 7868]|uniref:Type II secretion system protein J n=1 Tax=Vibrio aerogenes CECT 7868 TaxID=1216006 RepID=A0A1M5YUE7_9VIBR|nr:type II secretion system minor pseudopilin GspJ [Vibrio aerogenes]SHI15707.1 Type II secretion system protein J precursor [Vibrio aerogenes CECT 7868]